MNNNNAEATSSTAKSETSTDKPLVPTAQQIEALKQDNGEIFLLTAETGDCIVVKPPTKIQYKRFKDTATNEKKKAYATEDLVRDCLVFPSLEQFNALLEKRPALPDVFGAAVLNIAGGAEEAQVKKL